MDFIAQANIFGAVLIAALAILGFGGVSAFLLDMFRPASRLLAPAIIVALNGGLLTLASIYCLWLINLNI